MEWLKAEAREIWRDVHALHRIFSASGAIAGYDSTPGPRRPFVIRYLSFLKEKPMIAGRIFPDIFSVSPG